MLQIQNARKIKTTVVAADRIHEMPIVTMSIPPRTQTHIHMHRL